MLLSNENTIDELRSETMTDNELLLAISEMMDSKLKSELQPLKNDIQSIKNEVHQIKLYQH